MTSKDIKRRLIKENKNRLKDPNILDVRRTVSTRSPSSDLKCPMQIIFFLGQDDCFYLSTNSCLNHRHHPALKADWMVWNFYYDKSKIIEYIAGIVPKFLNVYHVRLKITLNIPFFGVIVYFTIGELLINQRYEFISNGNMNSYLFLLDV